MCFLLFTLSIILFHKSFLRGRKSIHLFVLLILSNSYLFLENSSSVDYPIALFFLLLAGFACIKQKYLLSSILFGVTIASRVNFLIFIYPSLLFFFFFQEIKNRKFKNLIVIFLITTIVGLIFYYNLFHLHNFFF